MHETTSYIIGHCVLLVMSTAIFTAAWALTLRRCTHWRPHADYVVTALVLVWAVTVIGFSA